MNIVHGLLAKAKALCISLFQARSAHMHMQGIKVIHNKTMHQSECHVPSLADGKLIHSS